MNRPTQSLDAFYEQAFQIEAQGKLLCLRFFPSKKQIGSHYSEYWNWFHLALKQIRIMWSRELSVSIEEAHKPKYILPTTEHCAFDVIRFFWTKTTKWEYRASWINLNILVVLKII